MRRLWSYETLCGLQRQKYSQTDEVRRSASREAEGSALYGGSLIRESDTLRKLWEKYRREYDYAKDISFEDTCNTVQEIMKAIML